MFTRIQFTRDLEIRSFKTIEYSINPNHKPSLKNIKNNLHNNFKGSTGYFKNSAESNDSVYNMGSFRRTNDEINTHKVYSNTVKIQIFMENGSTLELTYDLNEQEFAMTASTKEIFDKYEDVIAEKLFAELDLVLY